MFSPYCCCDIVVLKYFSMCIEVTLLNAGGEKAKIRALHVVIYILRCASHTFLTMMLPYMESQLALSQII